VSKEKLRLKEDREKKVHWRRWGCYLSEREWGTVREDNSPNGEAWEGFTFDDAKTHVYRWGEDGIAGICDNHQKLCFAWVFWNEADPILKERLFGLGGKEGNHGEDVKEYYFYLDNTPTHSYMKYLYKYPQRAFPYEQLRAEGKKRTAHDPEFELLDTGIFEKKEYFDIEIEYAKAGPEDIFCQATVTNRGPDTATLHLLPTLWFRNTWESGHGIRKPIIKGDKSIIAAEHSDLGKYFLRFENAQETLFTENETDLKDAIHRYLIGKEKMAVNSHPLGTKAAIHYVMELKAGESKSVILRLSQEASAGLDGAGVIVDRKKEADEFYGELAHPNLTDDQKLIQRQALSGMLWNKQFYYYVVSEWLQKPHRARRNADWLHVYNEDILSVPDKWEYPCFFSWDTAFHTIPLAMVDPEFAKKQLSLLTREWYMHPNGQIPAYEWNFSDVNPPVHAWAAWRVFKIEQKMHGREDYQFLEGIYQKLLLNFTWWVNRKDIDGKNVFQGGFLGLDNIGIFNRSELPPGYKLYQSDATSWMGMYALNMLVIALELAQKNRVYEDMASKFFEHFLFIANAMNFPSEKTESLWDEEDGFYYDVLVTPAGEWRPLKIRSMVGLIPLLSVATASPDLMNQFLEYRKRLEWFVDNRHDLCGSIASLRKPGVMGRKLVSIATPERLKRILSKMLDENEFLSPFGIRSLSKFHKDHPFCFKLDSKEYCIGYECAESMGRMYGGNSNWRGPVWFPLNMLIIESLQKYHYYFGDAFKVECPTGSGKWMTLAEVATEISKRLVRIFEKDGSGKRPVFGSSDIFNVDPAWKDKILFYEYFHSDQGIGLGASHQTGWTGLVAKLIQQLGKTT